MRIWIGLLLASCLPPALHAACTYTLSPGSRSHGYSATTNSLTVNADIGCEWSVNNTNTWLTILNSGTGTGTGVVTYAVSANAITTGRTGVMMIANLPFTIRQDQSPCNYGFSPTQRTHGNGGTSGASVTVNAASNCNWSVINTSSWINLTTSGSGTSTGSFSYTVLPNNVPVPRTNYLTIDNVAFRLGQLAAPCFYELSPTNVLRGHGSSTGLVTVSATLGCVWYVNNTNPWITIHVNQSGTNSGSFGYTVAPNPASTPRNGLFTVWDQSFTLYQQPAPCNPVLSPSSATPGAETETNVVNISIPIGCSWGVTNTNSWISFEGPTNGLNNGTLTWIAALNTNSLGRTGVVSISGQNFTVRQDPANCTYKLSPTNRLHGYGAASNSISLTVLSSCAWTLQNTNPWVTIHSPTNGFGSANIGYSIPVNGNLNGRTGVVVIAGQPFTIAQGGIGCAVDLTPTTRTHGQGATNNTIIVNIAANCEWNVLNTNSWITILNFTNGTGSNTVIYTVTNNPAAVARSGYITINEGTVLISQNAAPCNPSISPSAFTHTAAEETGTVSVTAPLLCDWTVENTNWWITLVSSTNGTAATNIYYTVATNLNPLARSGTMTIGGRVYTVTQNGVLCNYRLSPTNRPHGPGANANTLSVIVSNPCPWTASTTNSWITILSGFSGTGTGVISYAISANSSATNRLGAIMIDGDAVCTINQSGLGCGYALTPAQRTHGHGVASNSFNVTAGVGCPWFASTTNDWIALVFGTNGTASGTVGYTITANTSNLTDRIGYIAVDGQTFTITQRTAACAIDLFPRQRTHGHGTATNTFDVTIGTNCAWNVGTTNPWITITPPTNGVGSGLVEYRITENPTAFDRLGFLTVDAETFIITQRAAACSIDLTPRQRTHGPGTASNSFDVTVAIGCAWAASTTNTWITLVSDVSGVPNGTVSYTVSENFSLAERLGYIEVDTKTFVITQRAATCAIDLTPRQRSHGYGAVSASISISTAAGCGWTVDNTNSWITFAGPTTGTGNGIVNYTVAANPDPAPRSGNIIIGDAVFAISQGAVNCTFRLSPTNRNHGFGATTGAVNIVAGPNCAWNVATTNEWITITTPTTGSGNSNFGYNVTANLGNTARVGYITLVDQVLTLSQAAPTNGFEFESVVLGPAGDLTVRLAGGPAGIWELQSSSNLTNWVKLADLTNVTGRVEHHVPPSPAEIRFLRAVLP